MKSYWNRFLKWLDGKDVVEVCFAGPHLEPQKLKNSLQTKGVDNALDETFLLTPGEGGGDNRSFVTVVMNVSPENIQFPPAAFGFDDYGLLPPAATRSAR